MCTAICIAIFGQILVIGDSVSGVSATPALQTVAPAYTWKFPIGEDNCRSTVYALEGDRIDGWLSSNLPYDGIVVNWGLHDLLLDDKAQYTANLHDLLTRCKAASPYVLFRLTSFTGPQATPLRRLAGVQEWNAAAQGVCDALNIPTVDVVPDMTQALSDWVQIEDDVHYLVPGSQLMAAHVAAAVAGMPWGVSEYQAAYDLWVRPTVVVNVDLSQSTLEAGLILLPPPGGIAMLSGGSIPETCQIVQRCLLEAPDGVVRIGE